MALFSPINDPAEEYRGFLSGVQAELQPKNGNLHTYILDIRVDASKSQYYVNVLLDLLQSKGYEIVDVQYQYAVSIITDDGWLGGHNPSRLAIQRERSIMFLYK